MATKYLYPGATYCGDGTTSSAAASDGAAGAWNNLNILNADAEPAYGTLAAGDVVYIRSKDASGNNLGGTLSGNITLGNTNATATAPIYWLLDNGTIWNGIDGQLKYTSASNYQVIIASYNIIEAMTQDKVIIENTATTQANAWTLASLQAGSELVRALFDLSAKTSSYYHIVTGFDCIMRSCHHKMGNIGGSGRLYDSGQGFKMVFIDHDIELTYGTPAGIFFGTGAGGYCRSYEFIGGRIRGAGATTGQKLINITGTMGLNLDIRGMDIPKAMSIAPPDISTNSWFTRVSAIGLDKGVGGYFAEGWGEASSRSDNNPPVLSATIPGSTDKWSWWFYPKNSDFRFPGRLAFAKLYTQSAASKTITVEFLSADTISSIAKNNAWIDVSYVDSNGNMRFETTRVPTGGSIDSSSASWSATTWGAISFVKKKLSLTTSYSIKQNTMVNVDFVCALKSASANDILFIDPDFQLT